MATDLILKKETMSSLEIAELTGKRHADIMRDVRNLLEQGVNERNFALVDYTDAKGEKRPCYELTKKGCLILASGYDAKLRERIIDRWEELETKERQSAQPVLPQTYLEALKQLVRAEEEKQQLTLENKVMKPKAEYFDNLVSRNLLTNIRDTAKQLHLKQKHFVSLLLENKFIYRDNGKKLKPYAEFTPSYFEIKDYENNGHTGTQLLITPKGKEAFRLLWGKKE